MNRANFDCVRACAFGNAEKAKRFAFHPAAEGRPKPDGGWSRRSG
jgi:hypothetical protein